MHTMETSWPVSLCSLTLLHGWFSRDLSQAFISIGLTPVTGVSITHYFSFSVPSPSLVSALPNLSSRPGKKLETAGRWVWIPLRSSAHPQHPVYTNTHYSAAVEDRHVPFIYPNKTPDQKYKTNNNKKRCLQNLYTDKLMQILCSSS